MYMSVTTFKFIHYVSETRDHLDPAEFCLQSRKKAALKKSPDMLQKPEIGVFYTGLPMTYTLVEFTVVKK